MTDKGVRSSSSYESQIAELQRRLHEAIVQIEVANKEQTEKDLKLQQQVFKFKSLNVSV